MYTIKDALVAKHGEQAVLNLTFHLAKSQDRKQQKRRKKRPVQAAPVKRG